MSNFGFREKPAKNFVLPKLRQILQLPSSGLEDVSGIVLVEGVEVAKNTTTCVKLFGSGSYFLMWVILRC
jgi:hypothetical protein